MRALYLLPSIYKAPLCLCERRKLNDLSGFGLLASLCAIKIDAVAGDRQSAMQIVQLFAAEPYGLLAAPAKPFRPSRIAQDHLLRIIAIRLKKNLYTAVI